MLRLKKTEAEFVAQMQVMVGNVSPGLLAQAGVSTSSWDAVESEFNGFVTTINTASSAKAAAKSAFEAKAASNKSLRSKTQTAVDKFYATPSITNEQLTAIGLPPRATPTGQLPPITVTGLTATPQANGSVKLTWKRTGNSARTMFEIQVNTGEGWTAMATTLAVKFSDSITPLGITRSYRIVSTNTLGRSVPSASVSVFGEGDESTVRLAA